MRKKYLATGAVVPIGRIIGTLFYGAALSLAGCHGNLSAACRFFSCVKTVLVDRRSHFCAVASRAARLGLRLSA